MSIAMERLEAPTVRKATEGGYSPSFRCDACGKEIPKPAKGRVAWVPDENTTYLSVDFLHMGCVEEHRETRGGTLRTAELTDFVESLERYTARSKR